MDDLRAMIWDEMKQAFVWIDTTSCNENGACTYCYYTYVADIPFTIDVPPIAIPIDNSNIAARTLPTMETRFENENKNIKSVGRKNYQSRGTQQRNISWVVGIYIVQQKMRFSNFDQPLLKVL